MKPTMKVPDFLSSDTGSKVPVSLALLSNDERRALRRLRCEKQPTDEIGERLRRLHFVEYDLTGHYRITPDGERWLDNYTTQRIDVHWTRVLSIIAIVISAASLLLAGLSLYLQFR